MNSAKKARLEAAGWKVGRAAEFLELNKEEAAFVEMKRPETVAESRGRVGWLESVASCEDGVWRSFCESLARSGDSYLEFARISRKPSD